MKRLLLALFIALCPGLALAQVQCLGPNCVFTFTSSAVSTGSANAQTVSTISGQYVRQAGNSVNFVPGFSNSGPMTVNVDGTGAVAVHLNGVSLPANAITSGQAIVLIDNGTSFDIPALQTGGLAPLPSAQIWVGNGSGIATAVTPSGDLSLLNTGAFTVGSIGGKAVTLGAALTTTGAGAPTLAFPASPFTYTFQGSSDTILGRATTDTLTNKTFDTAGAGNVFKINGTQVSAVTGTGSAVLATSPTLVTPNIGVATGTSLSVSGQLASTVATGTAPLAVSSTTVVANLNASQLLGSTWASPAAIGTGTPAAITGTTLTANGKISTTSFLTASGDPGAALTASAFQAGFTSGFTKFVSVGANASTNGLFQLLSVRSDNSNGINVLLTDGSGNAIFGAGITTPTVTTASGPLQIGSGGGTTTIINDSAPTLPNITTGTNADVLCVTAGKVIVLQAAASCTISSLRFKNAVEYLSSWSGLFDVLRLDFAAFNMKDQESNPDRNALNRQAGLIAENVAAVDPRMAIYEDDGVTPKSYRIEAVLGATTAAIKSLQWEILGLLCVLVFGFAVVPFRRSGA